MAGIVNGITKLGDWTGGTKTWQIASVPIGAWNMDSTATVLLTAITFSSTEIYTVRVLGTTIIPDGGSGFHLPIDFYDSSGTGKTAGSYSIYTPSNAVSLGRVTGGAFDSVTYTSTTQNRGFVTLMYKPD